MATPEADSASLFPAEVAGAQFGVTRKGYDPDEVRAFLQRVAEHVSRLGEEARHAAARAEILEHQAASTGEAAYERVAKRFAGALADADRAVEQAAADARAEAERATEGARAEAATTLERARADAAAIVEQARVEAARIVAAARAASQPVTTATAPVPVVPPGPPAPPAPAAQPPEVPEPPAVREPPEPPVATHPSDAGLGSIEAQLERLAASLREPDPPQAPAPAPSSGSPMNGNGRGPAPAPGRPASGPAARRAAPPELAGLTGDAPFEFDIPLGGPDVSFPDLFGDAEE